MVALWLSGFILLLLSANSFAEIRNPREFSTCSFSFEKRWEIIRDEDADWQGSKVDFLWGEVEISDPEREWRVFQHVLSRDDYEDNTIYRASTTERVFANGTLTGSQHDCTGALSVRPKSAKDAVRAHRDLMTSNQQTEMYYFDPAPEEPFGDLIGFHFLGYRPEGLIWQVGSKRNGNNYIGVDLRKNQVRFQLDPESGLFNSATGICSDGRLDMNRVRREGQTDLYVAKFEGATYSDLQELQISNLKFDENVRVRWSSAPKNGTRIHNLAASQIRYVWQDGKPFKVLDRSVEDVEFMRFPRHRNSMVVLATIGILCVAYYYIRGKANT